MARKFSLNKTELTRLRREEKMYKQFLPVLQLKQEQLQIEQLKLRREVAARRDDYKNAYAVVERNASLLCEPLAVDLHDLVAAKDLKLGTKSVAGVSVPVLEHVAFSSHEISRFSLAPWVSRLLPKLRDLVRLRTELSVLEVQFDLVSRELRKATQKVNLFEKVLIPETKDGIRRIKIALGDQQVAAVGRGKIAKSKQTKAAAAAEAA